MKMYPYYSAMTIRQRIEKLSALKRKNDVYVNIHNNADGDGLVFGFYLDDWNSPYADFKEYPELDYRLDNETRSGKYLNLGFNPRRLKSTPSL